MGPGNDVWLSSNNSGEPIVFHPTSGNINAVGGYFFPTDTPGNVTTGTVTLTLDDGTSYSVTDPSATTFVGFVADGPIDSFTIEPGSFPLYATANDFIVGTAVPEASALLLSCIGAAFLVATGFVRRGTRAGAPGGCDKVAGRSRLRQEDHR